jgi:hypothetical protein
MINIVEDGIQDFVWIRIFSFMTGCGIIGKKEILDAVIDIIG